jgi:hypothetical protein
MWKRMKVLQPPSKVPPDTHTRVDGISCMTLQQPALQNNSTDTVHIHTQTSSIHGVFREHIGHGTRTDHWSF